MCPIDDVITVYDQFGIRHDFYKSTDFPAFWVHKVYPTSNGPTVIFYELQLPDWVGRHHIIVDIPPKLRKLIRS